jgi:Tol biopolymer transport system component
MMSKFWNLLALLGAALIATLVGGAGTADATFPGSNGRIAFDSLRTGTFNVFTMTSNGSDVKQLTHRTTGEASTPAWSPDGKRIAFEQGAADFSTVQIWLMNADGSNKHRVFSDPSFQDQSPSFSPDGLRLIFNRCSAPLEACAIYTIKLDGHGLTAITHFNQSVNDFDIGPKYAPDGKTIAFGSFNRGGVTAAVYLMGSHGANLRQLTPSGLEADAPDWAPDGTTLAFGSNCCNPLHAAIWTVTPDGTGLKQLTFPGVNHDFVPSYSPQGDQIAFERDPADFSSRTIMTIPASGGTPTLIQSQAGDPSWGPAP